MASDNARTRLHCYRNWIWLVFFEDYSNASWIVRTGQETRIYKEKNLIIQGTLSMVKP